MKNIAYKTAKGDPSLPDGFITDHFETDADTLEGYEVVSLDVFNALFQNNVTLVRKAESERGIVTVDPSVTSFPIPRLASEAENVPTDLVQSPTLSDNQALFNQFLSWIAAGKPTGPSNT